MSPMLGNKLPKVIGVVNNVINKGNTIAFKIKSFEDKIGVKNLVMLMTRLVTKIWL